MCRFEKKTISCGKKVENWRKNKMHDAVRRSQIRGDGCRPSCHNRQQPQPAVSRPATWCSEAGGHSSVPSAPLSCHCSESAADAWRCLLPARKRRRGLEIKLDLHGLSCCFHSMAYSMAYSMLGGIAISHLSEINQITNDIYHLLYCTCPFPHSMLIIMMMLYSTAI